MLKRCKEAVETCIPATWYCDGKADCPSGSDETQCSCTDWGTTECKGLFNATHCLPERWIQQGHPVCDNILDYENDGMSSKGIM